MSSDSTDDQNEQPSVNSSKVPSKVGQNSDERPSEVEQNSDVQPQEQKLNTDFCQDCQSLDDPSMIKSKPSTKRWSFQRPRSNNGNTNIQDGSCCVM